MSAGKGVLLKATLSQCLPRRDQGNARCASARAKLQFYAEFTQKQCIALGVEFVLKRIGPRRTRRWAEEMGCVTFKDVEGLHFKFHYNLYHNIRYLDPKSLISSVPPTSAPEPAVEDQPPAGTVKSILPCTPLAVVKCLEHIGVYNKILPYGDRAYGKPSEVVGRPLAALLANDGARVYSEYTKRPQQSSDAQRRFHPRHVVHPCTLSLQECLALSDVVVSAVPSAEYKVKTAWLKDGCVCVNVAADKNFEADVREKASMYMPTIGKVTIMMLLRNLCVCSLSYMLR
ncbi:uncharacterized protein B0H18DRAFT_1080824 [Fomitopsis serialis]|uniref:uncharacterized protein n=1 Tax=Fomitopsis serialis TaxID=139415 RepID=UPI002007A3EE|nr:uncharacterized protein B0H18DRAFT_1080824 [Neoantrodia serialis]KAH9938020.1 hypothetical protein B0H18DRAFT_1080824 [Neoantrodia serialis]